MFSRIETIERMADEGGHDARSTFLRVALEQFITLNQRPSHSEIERFSDLCLALIDQVDSSTRLYLATRLAPFHYAPLAVIERLLLDPHVIVSDEVIRRSCHFTHAELQQLCLEGKSRHACAVALRSDLDLTLVRHLVKHKSANVIEALLGNMQAPFDAEAVRLIILRVRKGDVEAHRLLQRQDIPMLWVASLYPYANANERRRLRIEVGKESGPPELTIPADAYPYLYTALLRRDDNALRQTLSRMLRLAPESMSFITDDKSGELLALAMIAAGCDEKHTLGALACIFQTHGSALEEFKSLIDILFEETSRRSARRIVTAVAEEATSALYEQHMFPGGTKARDNLEQHSRSDAILKNFLHRSAS